ncbi:sulfate adenylyltransferase subunit CysN [Aurantimonas sp. HBX-1]|uniref:sulfate adenylyltransferase subunit CysN n=1 Tax=Aurantimonas sp. HBX-1 TaxID=2906072 RepID=UPI001F42A549|nr:sulfate adenylyltransferase subunit CysN [Aurantimonas sp. HBX-1]UIJ71934.1 sulfate adenylyltransferase subunit CysN [Aurantimonas sp. HBX-1]
MTGALPRKRDLETLETVDASLAPIANPAVIAEDERFAGPAPDEDFSDDPLAGPLAPAASLLRFITCGSVDDGKSTLIGRLLYETNAVFDDQLETLKRDSKKFGTTGADLDFALLVDGLSAEREQGITIDVAYRYFSTGNRAFIIADTPGHEQYTRNMATGASQAELAVILVDARKGILPQTRRHSFITSLVGIKSVVVAINKMDLVDFSEDRFEAIKRDYEEILPSFGFTDVAFIPVSAKNGDNVAVPSPNMAWYRGRTLLAHLEAVEPPTFAPSEAAFRLPVQWVNRPHLDFRGFAGTIVGGEVRAGDAVKVMPGGRASRVQAVHGPDGIVESAGAGEAVTLTLADEVDVSRGDVIVAAADKVAVASKLQAEILWMAERPLIAGGRFVARLGAATTPAIVRGLDAAIDIHSFEARPTSALIMNEIGRVTIAFDRPPVATTYEANRELGSFILIDQLTNETVALGVVTALGAAAPRPVAAAEPEGAPARLQALWLGQAGDAEPALRRSVLLYRAAAALLVGFLAFLFGLGLLPALGLALLDLALRPFVAAAFGADAVPPPGERADPTTVGDGAGI